MVGVYLNPDPIRLRTPPRNLKLNLLDLGWDGGGCVNRLHTPRKPVTVMITIISRQVSKQVSNCVNCSNMTYRRNTTVVQPTEPVSSLFCLVQVQSTPDHLSNLLFGFFFFINYSLVYHYGRCVYICFIMSSFTGVTYTMKSMFTTPPTKSFYPLLSFYVPVTPSSHTGLLCQPRFRVSTSFEGTTI